MRTRALLANAFVLLIYILLSLLRKYDWDHYVRDWLPQALIILAYKQMGWFAPHTHTYQLEHRWIVWDRILLDNWHGRAIIESLGPMLPSVLELSYVLVYAVPPVTMLIIYRLGLQKGADTMLTIYLLGLFLCYAQFPFWPSEPPRVVFPGQDMPNIQTAIRTFSLWIVGSYGIHTSVFPSAHVSGAVAAAFGMAYLVSHRRLLVLGYFTYAALVATATVYGRYHYAVDALAGIFIGCVAFSLGVWLNARARKRESAEIRLLANYRNRA
jgi:membrane-associated phospholipid phosphatase